MSADDPVPPYKLTLSDLTRETIRRLIHRSFVLGVRNHFVKSLADIESALQNQPLAWGDPYDTRPALRHVRYRRIYDQLLVRYAVHQDQPVVWLTNLAPILRHPLSAGEG